MSLLLSPMAKNSSAGFYNGVATQSLRFEDGDSAYLSKTPSSASNRKTWTWSGWVKRGTLGNTTQGLFGSNLNANTGIGFGFSNGGSAGDNFFYTIHSVGYASTTALFRDPSAWYHVVVSFDSTQATASNRFIVYINNTNYSFGSNIVVQNNDYDVNNTTSHNLGFYQGASNYFDGYLAEVNFIDGLALTPTSFGETKNGVWIPIDTSGLTFGTNGFRLKFDQVGVGTASTSTIGADTSGNTNHLTSSGIVASDCDMPDSPENNFATMNPLYKTANNQPTFSEGNLKVASSQVAYQNTFSNFGVSSGKWYVEMKQNGTTNSSNMIGISSDNNFNILQSTSSYIGSNSGGENYSFFMHNGQKYSGGSGASYGSRTTDGQIIGVALDLDNGKIYFSVDGTYIASGDPAGGTGFAYENIASSTYYFGITLYTNGITDSVWNFGQDSTFVGSETATSNADGNGYGAFHTAPPSGFLALCTANLEEPTIGTNSDTQADNHFDIVLYAGNGSDKTISGLGFQPDWVWTKSRSLAQNHHAHDSSRGVENRLTINTNDQEYSDGELKTFTSDGFTFDTAGATNTDGSTNVAWCWKANSGTRTTFAESGNNPAGGHQANATAGFSIVDYTGTGSAGTIAHGLGASPEITIIKKRSGDENWYYQSALQLGAFTNNLRLDSTTGTLTSSTFVTAVSDTTVTVSTSTAVNGDGTTYIMYCFRSIEGYSKIGSYTGNGSTNGTFVYTGFRPAFVMFKITNTTGDWNVYDSARSTFNIVALKLRANTNGAEITSSDDFDILSNGFKPRDAGAGLNGSGNTYIYMAFAEAPFKYANAR